MPWRNARKKEKKTGLTSNWSYTRITHRNKCLFLLSVHEQSFFVCDVFFSRRLSVYFVHRLLILRRGRQDERREWKKKIWVNKIGFHVVSFCQESKWTRESKCFTSLSILCVFFSYSGWFFFVECAMNRFFILFINDKMLWYIDGVCVGCAQFARMKEKKKVRITLHPFTWLKILSHWQFQ